MTFNISKTAGLGAASALATVLVVGTAFADGVTRRGSIKDAPAPAPRACSLSANVGLTSDYVFRGFSQTAEGPAIQGGFDATCGMFYAGVWASSLDFAGSSDADVNGTFDASIEIGLVRRHQAEDRADHLGSRGHLLRYPNCGEPRA